MGRDVYLFPSHDAHQGQEAKKRCVVDEGGLVDKGEIGCLSSRGLKQTNKHHEEAPLYGLIRCITEGCMFEEYLTYSECKLHNVTHDHTSTDVTCKQLKVACKLLGVPCDTSTNCIFSRITEDPEQTFQKQTSTCKMISGLSQKYREALVFDSTNNVTNWIDKSSSKIQTNDIHKMNTCCHILMNMVPLVTTFLNFIFSDEFKMIYSIQQDIFKTKIQKGKQSKCVNVKPEAWWYEDDEYVEKEEIKKLCFRYMEYLHMTLFHPGASAFISLYRKILPDVSTKTIETMSIEELRLLTIPIVGVYNIVKTHEYDYNVIVYLFFKRTENILQSIQTTIDKTLHSISKKQPKSLESSGPIGLRILDALYARGCELTADE